MTSQRDEMIRSVSLLASESKDQIEKIKSLFDISSDVNDMNIDEIALDFEDIYSIIKNNDESLFNKNEIVILDKLEKYLTSISGSEFEELWNLSSLQTDKRWDNVRSLARNFLSEISNNER